MINTRKRYTNIEMSRERCRISDVFVLRFLLSMIIFSHRAPFPVFLFHPLFFSAVIFIPHFLSCLFRVKTVSMFSCLLFISCFRSISSPNLHCHTSDYHPCFRLCICHDVFEKYVTRRGQQQASFRTSTLKALLLLFVNTLLFASVYMPSMSSLYHPWCFSTLCDCWKRVPIQNNIQSNMDITAPSTEN